MPYFPGPLLTTEALAASRGRYDGLLAEAVTGRSYSQTWDAHRPTLGRLNEPDALYALPFLARLQLQDPANWQLIDDREAAFPKAKMMDTLSVLLRDFTTEHGAQSYFVPILTGILRYIDGFEQEAFDHFGKVTGEDAFYDVVKDDLAGAACARPLPSIRGARAFRGQAGFCDIHTHWQSASVERSLLSISADALYFRAFVPTWLPTCKALAPHGMGCHFHLIARSEAEVALLDEVVRWAKEAGVSTILTYEVASVRDRAYFTIRRFFAAQAVMDATGASVMVLDADLVVTDPGSIPGLFSRNEGISVALSSGPWQGFLPWRRISGGVVLLPACKATRLYLEVVTDLIEYFWLANDLRHWWVDQLALESGRLLTIKQWSDVFFRDFGPGIWKTFLASEDYKVTQLNQLPEVESATRGGRHWGDALRTLQL